MSDYVKAVIVSLTVIKILLFNIFYQKLYIKEYAMVRIKNIISVMLVTVFIFAFVAPVYAIEDNAPFEVNAKSALLMDYETGSVLYAYNADEPYPPASVTKIMTLLLIMEAVDSGGISLSDTVSASEYASSMGGSQIYLKAGEEMSVEDMIKSIVISSANDAAVAMAEKIGGSESAFVTKMNDKAKELGMKNTNFENVTGLDDDTVNHVTSAYDIALMSRALISHETILNYSGIWMDTIRDGAFGLTNTNRLVRFFNGATGLKTGSTSKAGFCMSATAKRDGMHLIAVIMGSPTRDERNEAAKALLEWGFANYCIYHSPDATPEPVRVVGGVSDTCKVTAESYTALLGKGKGSSVVYDVVLENEYAAPINAGDKLGEIIYRSDGTEIGKRDILAAETVERIGFGSILLKMLEHFFLK